VRKAIDKVRRDRITDSKVSYRWHVRGLAGERGWKAANDDHINPVSP